MITRREFLFGAIDSFLIGLGLYSHQLEPGWLELSRKVVRLPACRRPVRLVHLADLHLDCCPSDSLQRAIGLTHWARPDLIRLTGDYVYRKLTRRRNGRSYLRRLTQIAPTVACTGNHDGGAWAAGAQGYASSATIRKFLKECEIRCLHNGAVNMHLQKQLFNVAGVGDPWAAEFRPEQAFRGLAPSGAAGTVLLCHNPDVLDKLLAYPWDLLLCGHSHGGQLRVPLFEAAPFAPLQDRSRAAGLYRPAGRYLHVTRGLASTPQVRFNCRPEVAVIDILPE